MTSVFENRGEHFTVFVPFAVIGDVQPEAAAARLREVLDDLG